jgi:hypothetical protein
MEFVLMMNTEVRLLLTTCKKHKIPAKCSRTTNDNYHRQMNNVNFKKRVQEKLMLRILSQTMHPTTARKMKMCFTDNTFTWQGNLLTKDVQKSVLYPDRHR